MPTTFTNPTANFEYNTKNIITLVNKFKKSYFSKNINFRKTNTKSKTFFDFHTITFITG